MYRTDNEEYVNAFALQLIKEAEPVLIDPPNILQMGLIVDRTIHKITNVYVPFDGYLCPHSTELKDAIETHAITESCFIERRYAKNNMVLKHEVRARELSHYVGPISQYPNPLIIPAEIVLMFAGGISWTADKVLKRKNLPLEYRHAEEVLEKKFLGKTGLTQMKNEIEKCKKLSEQDLYAQARKIYMNEHPDFSQKYVSLDTVFSPEERQEIGI